MSTQQAISEVTRRNILDELIMLDDIPGKLGLIEFLSRIWPLHELPSTDGRFRHADGDILQHMINNNDWNYHFLFEQRLDLIGDNDEMFLKFVEQIVHPTVRANTDSTSSANRVTGQSDYASLINKHLVRDGFRLEPVDHMSGYPIFKAVDVRGNKVAGRFKNLIFAAIGEKPEIVLADSINNDIRIVKNAENCLVYDLPISHKGLLWTHLVQWWKEAQPNLSHAELAKNLYQRLAASLMSEPEKLLFRYYYRTFNADFKERLPALIPQVYLHYDPYTMKQLGGITRLARWRGRRDGQGDGNLEVGWTGRSERKLSSEASWTAGDVLGLLEEAQSEQILDLSTVDLLGPGPVEVGHGAEAPQAGALDTAFEAALAALGFVHDDLPSRVTLSGSRGGSVGTTPGTVKFCESPGKAEGFPKY